MHYKIIFLIISSDNEPVYAQMREILPKYLNLYFDKIQYFFIECNSEQSEEVVEKDHYLYCKGVDSTIPGIFHKTMKSMNYLDNHYSCDFVVRTNLSTFWHMDNLLKLVNTLPTQGYAGGFCFAKDYLSGTTMIFSSDVIQRLIPYSQDSRALLINDDVAISIFLHDEKIPIQPVKNYSWDYTGSLQIIQPDHNVDNVLNFRIKNQNNDRKLDVINFKILLQKIYGITFP